MENKTLLEVLRKRIDEMPYGDKTRKNRSGMTKLQEYLRRNGIKEHRNEQPYDKDKYIKTEHPAPWACEEYHESTYCLLVPKELAIKITILESMP